MTVQDREARPSDDASDSFAEDWRRAQAEIGSIGQAVGSISDELRILVARERELAQAEVADAVTAATQVGIWGAIAAIVGLVAFVFTCVAIMFGIDVVLPLWAAALITALLLVVVAVAAAIVAKQHLDDLEIVPVRTLHSLQEGVTWAVGRMKRNAA